MSTDLMTYVHVFPVEDDRVPLSELRQEALSMLTSEAAAAGVVLQGQPELHLHGDRIVAICQAKPVHALLNGAPEREVSPYRRDGLDETAIELAADGDRRITARLNSEEKAALAVLLLRRRLRVSEIAERLGVDPHTVREWSRQRRQAERRSTARAALPRKAEAAELEAV